ncbi:MAG: hypothetical protein QNJ92_09195 [Alphaproteobacteria bacterium]|nr:hypothetical protein [Alphaproteobacteria bacterium]
MAKQREKPAARAARDQRLAAALRENLRRRKAQQRGRADPSAAGEAAPDDGADPVPGTPSDEER